MFRCLFGVFLFILASFYIWLFRLHPSLFMKVKEILANCAVLQNGSYYLGCAYPKFKDPIVEKVKFLIDNGYEFKLKEISIFGEETYFCDKLNLSYQTDYNGDSTLHYSG